MICIVPSAFTPAAMAEVIVPPRLAQADHVRAPDALLERACHTVRSLFSEKTSSVPSAFFATAGELTNVANPPTVLHPAHDSGRLGSVRWLWRIMPLVFIATISTSPEALRTAEG